MATYVVKVDSQGRLSGEYPYEALADANEGYSSFAHVMKKLKERGTITQFSQPTTGSLRILKNKII